MNTKLFRTWVVAGLVLAQGLVGDAAWAGKCPKVAVLIDRSGSMGSPPGGAETRTKLQIATETTRDKIAKPYNLRLPLGLGLFPSGTTSCAVDATLKVPMAYGNFANIDTELTATTPGASTPMCDAITAAAADTGFSDPERGNFIVLLTDGLPNCTCTVASTADAITAARMRPAPVHVIVVGFGIDATEHAQLDQIAAASAISAKSYGQMQNYFKADNAAGLAKVLDQVMGIVTGGDAGGGGQCDDSCYQNACTGGKVCINGDCKTNPCTGYACPMGTYCRSDGTKRSCATPCMMSCASGKSCDPMTGMCKAEDCAGLCNSGERCNGMTKTCETDPLCDPMTVSCKSGQWCRAGSCIEDPCRYTTCPAGAACIPFSGACETLPIVTLLPGADSGPKKVGPAKDGESGSEVEGGIGCSLIPDASPGGSGRTQGLLSTAGLIVLGIYRARRRRHQTLPDFGRN